MIFETMGSALKNVFVSLKKVHRCYYVGSLHKRGKHVLLKPDNGKSPVYYMLFKREFFLSFSKQFKDFTSKNKSLMGYGESINSECLDYAIKNGADRVMFTYQSGVIYYTYPNMIKRFCEKNNLVRVQEETGEKTYSFPLKVLDRLERKVIAK